MKKISNSLAFATYHMDCYNPYPYEEFDYESYLGLTFILHTNQLLLGGLHESRP